VLKIARTRLPGVVADLTDTGHVTTPLWFDVETDLWEEMQTLAKAVGCALYFNAVGTMVMSPVHADQDDSQMFRYTPTTGNLLDISRVVSSDDVPNGYVVYGKALATSAWEAANGIEEEPVARGEVWDEDQTSTTFRGGTYGEVLKTEENEFVFTNAQATTAAAGELAKVIGGTDSVTFSCLPNLAMDVDDIVWLEDDGLQGVYGKYLTTDLSIPLGPEDAMDVTAQRKAGRLVI
jgi:hypothetical protein